MKRIIDSFVLLGLFCTLSAHSQIYKPGPFINPTDEEWNKRKEPYLFNEKLSYWWWMCTYPQVRDKIVAEPGWDVYALNENFDSESKLLVHNEHADISMIFSFTKTNSPNTNGKLFRRRYIYSLNSPSLNEWKLLLSALPYNQANKCWIDTPHHAEIVQGTNEDGSQTIYEVTLLDGIVREHSSNSK